METLRNKSTYPLLPGGGEMGELLRTYDWSQTTLGTPDVWPYILRASISNMLNTGIPMLVLWGTDFTCFYNDAFAPSLDPKMHTALGRPAKEIWAEGWSSIGPVLQTVLDTGESVTFRDAPVVFYRNGTTEDGYWTGSYSAILGDDGELGGILVTCLETTEAVKARMQLQESEVRFRSLIEEAPVATCLFVGRRMVIEVANDAMIQVWGKGPSVIGMPLAEALPELKGQHFLPLLDELFTTGNAYSEKGGRADLVVDGRLQTFYFDYDFKTLRTAEGTIYAILETAVDVTAQVLAKRALEKSESNLRNMILQAPVAMCIFKGPEHVVEIANERMFEFWGKQSADVLHKPIFEGLPEAKGQGFEELLVNVYTTGKTVQLFDVPVTLPRHGKLKMVYINFVYEAFKEAGGAISGVMAVALDVTEQVMARRKIEESEEALRTMVLAAPVGMCVIDAPSLVSRIVNESFIEIAGKSSEAIIGQRYWDTFSEARPYYEEALQGVVDTGIPYYANEVQLMLIRHGKEEIVYVTFVYMPIKDAEGTVTKVAIYVLENTPQVIARRKIEDMVQQRTAELARANETLLLTNKELQRSNSNLEEFAHAASHDLKEPIRKILFFTHQLKDQLAERLKGNEQRSFHRIENATERMGNLIDDLLLYSHVSHRPHETEAVDLNAKVQKVLEDLELDIAERHADMHVGTLPVVHGYGRQLQQLFQNLISNSLKYSKEDEPPRIHIQASTVEENGLTYHVITVRDNGIGFEQQYAETIFQMFSRLHGRNEYSGTGVGLSIVKKVIENHQGFIRVESTVGEGSVFAIYLPA